jgi:hypothetical protein
MVTSTTADWQAQIPSQHVRLDMLQGYQVELAQHLLDEQGQLIDWLIDFAFDALGARVLDLRVVPSDQS